MPGFVYVLSNPSMPNLLKIGKTDRDPTEYRVTELYTTGVPERFKLEYFVYVENHHQLERNIHRKFRKQRPNKDREFFLLSVERVVIELREYDGILYEKLYYVSESDIASAKERQRIYEEAQKRLEEDRAARERKEAFRIEEARVRSKQIVDQKAKDYARLYAKIPVPWFWLAFFGLNVLVMVGMGFDDFTFALTGFSLLIGIPCVVMEVAAAKNEQAQRVFTASVRSEVERLCYEGKDFENYLAQVLANVLHSNHSAEARSLDKLLSGWSKRAPPLQEGVRSFANKGVNKPSPSVCASERKRWRVSGVCLINTETNEAFKITTSQFYGGDEVKFDGRGYEFHLSAKYVYVNEFQIDKSTPNSE
jgi:hypothetical protein